MPGPEPHGGEHRSVPHDGGDLRLHGLGGPFDGPVEGRRLILVGRDRSQELGQLLGVPLGPARSLVRLRHSGSAAAHATARTTSVWL